MRTSHEEVLDDLDALVAGDPAAIARHADHLASCDSCRDARHDAAQLAARVGDAGADYVANDGLAERLLATLDEKPAQVADVTPLEAARRKPASRKPAPRKQSRGLIYVAGAMAAFAAGTVGLVALKKHDRPLTVQPARVANGGPIGTLKTIARAAAEQGDGIAIADGSGGWRPMRSGEMIPAGAKLRTDERTRGSLDLADGTRIVLDHRTELAFDAAEPRKMTLAAGRIAADVAHVDGRPASIVTPRATIDVIGTRFTVTASDTISAVQVVRGAVVLDDRKGQREEVRAGEEGVLEAGKLTVNATPSLAKENAWSELAPPAQTADDTTTAGLGALRAYKPGEKRDRDWKLALANHEVKVRISGPVARTEITETFRNDSDTQLEGVYQFPLPPDAQIDSLQLDNPNQPDAFITGAFVDKERAAKIWRGVIEKATPKIKNRDPLIQQEIVWVPGPWKDPALLDWQRGGRFELRIFPIPAKGSRTIKIAYTQVVTPRGGNRQYVYPLPHSTDGSTVADKMKIDVEVRGAAKGSVRAAGYQLTADAARGDVNAMTLEQGGFVPRGDLVVDYRPDSAAELRAWTFAGGAAVGPDDKQSAKKNVGIDPKVVEAQKAVAADARPTAVLALAPKLPRWRESKARDYVIVVDGSQSMVGERYARASELAVAMVDDMDRRDRFNVMVCDSDCTKLGDLRAPTIGAAGEVKSWLAAQQPAGSSDVVAALRAGNRELTGDDGAQREKWVLYIGDGFASTGFRRVSDVEHAIADTTHTTSVNISTVGIGTDADSALLAAAARGGGGSYIAWVPGLTVGTAALAALESTYGTTLRDATVEVPAALAEVAAAGGAPGDKPNVTALPTLRAGGEVLIAARMAGEVKGDVILRGKVAGQPFEQRYPVELAVSSSPGNGFVPRLWASLAIDELERAGKGEDRAKVVAMSQGYGVMSRQTSLLVLESQAMFDAFGVDRGQPTTTWTGEEDIDEVAASGTLDVPADNAPDALTAGGNLASGTGEGYGDLGRGKGAGGGGVMGPAPSAAPAPATKAATAPDRDDEAKAAADEAAAAKKVAQRRADKAKMERTRAIDVGDCLGNAIGCLQPQRPRGRRMVIQMKKVWTRSAALGSYSGVSPSITNAVAKADDALAENPDSREKHRALVQALSYAGELDRARDVANRWLERDKLDPQALGYIADLLGRDGKRDLALRTLDGLVDLDADRVVLHERMINAYERTGRLSQACSHRIAIVTLDAKQSAKRAAAAARCLRSLGRANDAELVMKSLVDDKARTEAEKLATVAPVAPRLAGDLVINGTWDGSTDLDISLVAPDGSRVSWMGGRTDITVADSTARDREQLAVRRLRKGNYLVEVNRADPTSSPIHGTVSVTVLGQRRSFPFELTGTHATVGQISVTMHSHMEPVNPADARFLGRGPF
jgi:tetratricopeptide (TPR) repeat protein